MGLKRVNVSFDEDEEWKMIQRFCKRFRPFQKPGTTIRELLRDLVGVVESDATAGNHADFSDLVTACYTALQRCACPDPPVVQVQALRVRSPQKEEENKKRNKREPGMASMDISEKILSDLNSKAGTGFKARNKAARKAIYQRMKDGAEFEDFITVNTKMAALWKDNVKMQHCLRPDILYGSKFESYLGSLGPTGHGKKQGSLFDTKPEPQGIERELPEID